MRLQDLQIEPIGGEEKPANTPGQGQAQEIDTSMASFESLRPVGDDQFTDFSENVQPPIEIEDIPEASSGSSISKSR